MKRKGRKVVKHAIKDDLPAVLFRTSHHNTIFDVLRSRAGWEETHSDTDWDINWADTAWVRENFDHIHFEDHQRVNHFRNHYELTRKDLTIKNLKRMKRHLERNESPIEASKFAFFPMTFVLPAEYGLFVEQFKKMPGATWIMKPIGKAQGKGIFLFNRLSQISEWKKDHRWKAENPQAETYIAQRYIDRPLLIGQKKFDMRLYILVTSFSPLVAWQARCGFCRFSQTLYSGLSGGKAMDIDNTYMHLTNVAIQKQADDFVAGTDSKWSLRMLKQHLIMQYGREAAEQCFFEISMVMIRSLLAVQKSIIQDRHCFEFYGFDIMLDYQLKPWLIEVNSSPSLTASTINDYFLKFGMLEDVISIVDMEAQLYGDEEQVGSFDLVWDGTYVPNKRERLMRKNKAIAAQDGGRGSQGRGDNPEYGPLKGYSLLGCFNDREQQVRKLHKETLVHVATKQKYPRQFAQCSKDGVHYHTKG